MPVRFSFDTRATPQQVQAASTDVGDRRLEIWRHTLDPAEYQVLETGQCWAAVREGSRGTRIWVLLRYEWGEPGTIRWTLLDSDHCDRGDGEIVVAPLPDGGSRVHVRIDHGAPRGLRGRAILLGQRLAGPIAFPRTWRSALDELASGSG